MAACTAAPGLAIADEIAAAMPMLNDLAMGYEAKGVTDQQFADPNAVLESPAATVAASQIELALKIIAKYEQDF